MSARFVIYSYVTLFLIISSYYFFDLIVAQYFAEVQRGAVWQFFRAITDSGEGFYWIVPTGLMYLFYRYFPLEALPFAGWFKRNRLVDMRNAGFIALSALASGLTVNLLKLVFARYRPVEYFQSGNFGMTWFDHGFSVASFPSGHSATAMGVAMAFALLFPRLRYPFLFYGALVTFSRVVINKHYFSDVLAGGFVGIVVTIFIYQRYFKLPRKG